MNDADKKAVKDIVAMFKSIKVDKVPGTDLVHNALYAWNRSVKEAFFKNFACAYLFIKAEKQIKLMQVEKSKYSKDNTTKKTKAIEKKKGTPKKESLTPQQKVDIYTVIIEEYKELAFELSLSAKNFPFLHWINYQ